MYSLGDYGGMIADPVRTPPYVQAIETALKPGSIVADVGCGSGFFSLVACRAGAKRVYAIDEAEIIHVGEQFAAANGCADRIKFLRGDSRQIQLPEKVDLIVSDLRGALPFFGHSIVSIEDARKRFLADGGSVIPQRDTLYAAIVEAEKAYEKITSPWKTQVDGLNLSSALSSELNSLHQVYVKPEDLLTDRQAWCQVDYTKDISPNAGATLLFRAIRAGNAHGVVIWFDTHLYQDIGFSCAPGIPKTVYGHIFLPWLEPLPVSAGQEIKVDLHANLVGSDYIWRWETQAYENKGGAVRHFKQSSLQGAQLSPGWLRKHAADFVPALSPQGEAERWLLQAIDGSTPLQEIAEHASRRFPDVFRCQEDAFRRVTLLVERFSR